MRFRPAGGFDLAAGALILGGAGLAVGSIVAAVVLLAPRPSEPTAVGPAPAPGVVVRASAALPPGRVAAVLTVDVGAGAGGAARSGDHVDVLGYFSRQVTGAEAMTRVLVQDVPVMTADRAATGVALTLAIPRESALLLQEAQALGARPFVTVRPIQQSADLPASFSDSDLANRLTGGR
jgi:Flp pilus assembly protein RcpC/CpaB